MNTAMPVQQRGITFGGFILGAFLLVLFVIIGFKLIPVYIENAKINSIFESIAHDPDMQKATPQDILASFYKRAEIDGITAIKAEDIDISDDSGRLILSASYPVKTPLFGNVSLYIEFHPSSAGK